ncbi:MAG TPA: LysM peptidoglycan-binding domain-containing protein [Parachlamydiaceae bacterium]|nr:LysM peptidoglycan-binding domain-containing protein [Parachlamydiaceae bacterium]
MKIKNWLYLGAAFAAFHLNAAPHKYAYVQEGITIREMQASIDDFRHEVQNHETEIRTFEEKLANQEVVIESLREESRQALKTNQESGKASLSNLEMKINSCDTALKGLISDFKELKTHLNHAVKKTTETEKTVRLQAENLELFQSALNSIMAALEIKHEIKPHEIKTADGAQEKIHKVQPGDSLGKIAKLYKTTIKALKEANNLNSDRVVVGQNIKIPS